MSVDGPGLFEDDTAYDVREQFTRLLADTQESATATERLLAAWNDSLQRSDEGPVIWLALAATQWRYGCLQPQVAAGAVEVIESGSDLSRWRGSLHEQQRVAVLRRLQKQLSRPQPAFRLPKLRKERVPAPRCLPVGGQRLAEADERHGRRAGNLCCDSPVSAALVPQGAPRVRLPL
jgi:hypothetical protein